MTVMPSSLSSLTICHSSCRDRGSTPTPGSSSSSTRGAPSKAQAMPSFCFMPPESFPASRSVNGFNAVNVSSFSNMD